MSHSWRRCGHSDWCRRVQARHYCHIQSSAYGYPGVLVKSVRLMEELFFSLLADFFQIDHSVCDSRFSALRSSPKSYQQQKTDQQRPRHVMPLNPINEYRQDRLKNQFFKKMTPYARVLYRASTTTILLLASVYASYSIFSMCLKQKAKSLA